MKNRPNYGFTLRLVTVEQDLKVNKKQNILE